MRSLLLLLAFATFLSLFSEQAALGLEPLPSFLHVFSSLLHILLLLDLGLLLRLFLSVIVVSLLLLQLQRFELGVYSLDLQLGLALVFLDLLGLLLEALDLVVLALLNEADFVLELVVLLVVVLNDLGAYRFLDLDLLTQVDDFILEFCLVHLLLALHAGDGTGNDAFHVLHLQLGLSLRLIDVFLQLTDVLNALLGLDSELLIVLFELVLILLDLVVAELLLAFQLVKTAVFLDLLVHIVLELDVLVGLTHLLHEVVHLIDDVASVVLHEVHVADSVRVFMQLAAELESGCLQVFGDKLDLVLRHL